MADSNRKTNALTGEALKRFGKHVSREKALLLFIGTMLACALPALNGIRLWDRIPEIVETGLIGSDGRDDSLPRAVLVYGVPGLMCALNLICHGQLWLNQKRGTLPATPVRLIGRGGIPFISVLFVSAAIIRAAGEKPDISFFAPCILSLLLMLAGGHFFDCPRSSKLALHLKAIEYKEKAWQTTHRIAGICCMAAGLITLTVLMLAGSLDLAVLGVTLLLLAFPIVYACKIANRS